MKKLPNSVKLILLVGMAAYALWQYTQQHNQPEPPLQNITYTKHARCRMQCRQIDETEVAEIIAQGHINKQKSNAADKPCPTIAYEGISHDKQHLRIVAAQCSDALKIVTCIDLKTDFPCQ